MLSGFRSVPLTLTSTATLIPAERGVYGAVPLAVACPLSSHVIILN